MAQLDLELAAKLKEEGNKFFGSKQYSQAYDKYSKALKVGGDNAILYANRSACSFAMGKYLDASWDGKKATELDANYAKGWGRKAAAEQELGNWEKAITSYETALAKLPTSGLSAAEKKQKDQYEAGLRFSKKRNEPAEPAIIRSSTNKEMPYERARVMIESLKAQGQLINLIDSSANIAFMAGNDFRKALDGLEELRQVRLPGGQMGLAGRLNVLENMSNAILSDRRSFFIERADFIQKYNQQVTLQTTTLNAWTEGGPDVVLAEAQERVRTHGWDDARQALGTTVRGWIMRAFMSAGLRQDHTGAEQFYRNVVDIIARGRELWPDVPKDDRGAIFQLTFFFGVRSLHLESFMQAHAATGGRDPRFSPEELDILATSLLADVSAERERKESLARASKGEGFWLAYYVYPAAEACAMKAYALKHKARGKRMEESSQLWGESAEFYWQAAKLVPEDDELHCMFIMFALGSWWTSDDVKLKTTLPLLAQLKKSAPKMIKIWENSALSMQGRDDNIKKCLNYHERMLKRIEEGSLTEEDSFNPSFRI